MESFSGKQKDPKTTDADRHTPGHYTVQRPTGEVATKPAQPATPSTPASQQAKFHDSGNVPVPGNEREDQIHGSKPGLKSQFKGFLSVVELLGGALILALIINNFIFQSYQVFGKSMVTTLNEGDRLIISKVSRTWSSVFGDNYLPPRGTIIVFNSPLKKDVRLIKRVIGLPGERVVVKDGVMTVYNDEFPDGFVPDEQFDADFAPTTGNVDITVTEGHLFVSGDNRTPGGSLDSRNDLGLVPIDNVSGELVLRLFPLQEAEFF